MRWSLLVICAMSCAFPRSPAAQPAIPLSCLNPGDTLDVVTSHKVVEPGEALRLARRAVPNAEVLRAALCRAPDALVFLIVLLRRDGRIVRVTVDALSGKITSTN